MTPVLTPQDFARLGAPVLVYVREVKASAVIGSTRVEGPDGIAINPDQTLYALHGADGSPLAVLIDRDTALAAAVQQDWTPVSVH